MLYFQKYYVDHCKGPLAQSYHQHTFFFLFWYQSFSNIIFISPTCSKAEPGIYNQYHSSILYFKFIHPLLCSVLVSSLRYKILCWLHYIIGELDLRFWRIVNKISCEFCSCRCIMIKSYLLFFLYFVIDWPSDSTWQKNLVFFLQQVCKWQH